MLKRPPDGMPKRSAGETHPDAAGCDPNIHHLRIGADARCTLKSTPYLIQEPAKRFIHDAVALGTSGRIAPFAHGVWREITRLMRGDCRASAAGATETRLTPLTYPASALCYRLEGSA